MRTCQAATLPQYTSLVASSGCSWNCSGANYSTQVRLLVGHQAVGKFALLHSWQLIPHLLHSALLLCADVVHLPGLTLHRQTRHDVSDNHRASCYTLRRACLALLLILRDHCKQGLFPLESYNTTALPRWCPATLRM